MSVDIQPKISRAKMQISLDVWPLDQIWTSQIVGRVVLCGDRHLYSLTPTLPRTIPQNPMAKDYEQL